MLEMRINNNLLLICPRLLTSWFINIGEMSALGHFSLVKITKDKVTLVHLTSVWLMRESVL